MVLAALAALLLMAATQAQAQRAPILPFTETDQILLTTYAEFLPAGILRLSSGSRSDAGDTPLLLAGVHVHMSETSSRHVKYRYRSSSAMVKPTNPRRSTQRTRGT
jgi:hypothetical protein